MAPMTERKSPIEQALDLFFYAPLGFLLNAQEVVPELIEKGHQQVVVARMFGKFAIENEAPKQIAELQKQVQKVAEQFTARAGGRRQSTPPAPTAVSSNGPSAPAAQTETSASVARPPAHGPGAAGLAIVDYDSLSASQVVPRLEGLSDTELAAVRNYEAAHRGRKTILNKIAQLQG
jgi:hypothetical protein